MAIYRTMRRRNADHCFWTRRADGNKAVRGKIRSIVIGCLFATSIFLRLSKTQPTRANWIDFYFFWEGQLKDRPTLLLSFARFVAPRWAEGAHKRRLLN